MPMTLHLSTNRLVPLAAAVAACFAITAPAATIVVNSTAATATSQCSIVDAVTSLDTGSLTSGCANSGAAFGTNDTIDLSQLTMPATISFITPAGDSSDALILNGAVNIVGKTDSSGRPLVTIQRDSSATSQFRLITLNGNTTINGVVLGNGYAAALDGGAIFNNGAVGGGGINLTINNSTITGNRATGSGSGGGYGGGIYLLGGSVSLYQSTVSGNSASLGGGGIEAASGGNISSVESTISGNVVNGGSGGGIYANGTFYCTNSTITRNTATSGSGVFANGANLLFCTISSNSIVNGATGAVLIGNTRTGLPTPQAVATLIYGNTGGKDVDSLASGLTMSGSNDLIGTHGANIAVPAGTLTCNPNLGALASNGGPTQTMALTSGSCAIDAGPASTSGLASDQRGALFERRSGSATDIGAFEYQPSNDRIFYSGFEAPQ